MTDQTTARARAEDLARRIESQANISTRPGQLDELEQIAREVRALAGAPTADVAEEALEILGDEDGRIDLSELAAELSDLRMEVSMLRTENRRLHIGAPTADVDAFVDDTESQLPLLREPDELSDWSKGVVWTLDRARVYADNERKRAAPEGVDAADELTAAQAAIGRVRAVHRPDEAFVCDGCSDDWPCPTLRAFEGDTTEEGR